MAWRLLLPRAGAAGIWHTSWEPWLAASLSVVSAAVGIYFMRWTLPRPPVWLYIQTPGRQVLDLEVPSEFSVARLKRMLEQYTRIAPDCQRLVFRGRVLPDEQIIADLNMPRPPDVIFLVQVVAVHG